MVGERKMRTLFLSLGLSASVFFGAELASADGVAVRAQHVPSKARSSLVREIKKARTKNPTIFKRVSNARALAVSADQNKRGRVASITRPLQALGKEALLPMLEMLAIKAPHRGPLSDTAWTTLRVGLLEAVGSFRDQRSRPVLETIIKHEKNFDLVRAASEAMGRLGDNPSARTLVALAEKPQVNRLGVLAGLGECRRIVAAKALAKASRSAKGKEMAIVLDSLADVGNAWAWETPAVQRSKEGSQVRKIAARALVDAFLQQHGQLQEKAAKSLLVVDHAGTRTWLQAARPKASKRKQAAIDAFLVRFKNNPIR